MIFWITAAVIAFLATLSVIVPLSRNKEDFASELEHDKALYKSRIDEIERDLTLKRISDEQAQSAKAEEARKLIAIAKADSEKSKTLISTTSLKFYRSIQLLCVVLVPVISITIYLNIGNPAMPDQSLASRLSADPQTQSFEEIVARAEAHLSKAPNDVNGWVALAPAYTRMGRKQDAIKAWTNILRLSPTHPQVRSLLAEAILDTTGGVVTQPAKKLFEEELRLNPASARARYYIALAFGQEGLFSQSAKAWQVLIDGANPQSPWLNDAKQLRDDSMKKAGLELSDLSELENPYPASQSANVPIVENGPTREQVEAAQNLSKEDREAMIETMVENLADKLEEDPSDQQGWKRLIRALMVLEKHDEALKAISTASENHKTDEGFIAEINSVKKLILSKNE